jgi:hypothetical protein
MKKIYWSLTVLLGAACAFAQARPSENQYQTQRETITTAQVATTSEPQQRPVPPTPTQATTQMVYAYGVPVHRLSITNTATRTCRLVTVAPVGKLGRHAQTAAITDLAPGETVSAGEIKRKGGLFNPFSKPSLMGYDRSSDLNIPFVCMYFTTEGGKNKYVGAAGGTLRVPGGGYSSVSQLTFTEQNIRFADDIATSAPKVQPMPMEKYATIPYFGSDGASVQIFVWNSTTPARISVNGGPGEELQLGTVGRTVGWSPIIVTITAIEGGQVKTWQRAFQNGMSYGTSADIFILGMSDLR